MILRLHTLREYLVNVSDYSFVISFLDVSRDDSLLVANIFESLKIFLYTLVIRIELFCFINTLLGCLKLSKTQTALEKSLVGSRKRRINLYSTKAVIYRPEEFCPLDIRQSSVCVVRGLVRIEI